MSGALERIAAPEVQPGWDLPPPEDPQHVFQVLDHQGKPIVSSPTPTELGRPLGTAGAALYFAEELAGLVREVLADPRKLEAAERSHTNCTQRFRLERIVVLSQGVRKRVQGSIISYGAITFVSFDLESAEIAQGQGPAQGTPSPLPSGKRALEVAGPDESKRPRTNGQDVYGQQQHHPINSSLANNGHSAQPAPFNPHALNPAYPHPNHSAQLHIDPALRAQPQLHPPSNGQLGPGQARFNPALHIVADRVRGEGQALSPTVASASAILGSFSTGPPGSAHDFPLSPQRQHQHQNQHQKHQSMPPSAPPGNSQAPNGYAAYAPSGLGQYPQQAGQAQYNNYPHQPSTSAAYSLPPPAGGQYAYASQQHQQQQQQQAQFHPGYQYSQGMQPTSAQQPLPYPNNGQHHPHHQQYYHQLQQQHAYPAHPTSQLPPPSLSPAPSHPAPTPSPNVTSAALPPPAEAVAPTPSKSAGGRAKTAEGGGAPVRESKPSASGQACESCGTETSPEWRKGPSGIKSLCNACGLRYARQVARRNKLEKQKEAGVGGGEAEDKGKKGKKGSKGAGAGVAAPTAAAAGPAEAEQEGEEDVLDPALATSAYGDGVDQMLDPSLQGAGASGPAPMPITSHPYYPPFPPVHTVVGELKEGAQEPIPYGSQGGDIQVNP